MSGVLLQQKGQYILLCYCVLPEFPLHLMWTLLVILLGGPHHSLQSQERTQSQWRLRHYEKQHRSLLKQSFILMENAPTWVRGGLLVQVLSRLIRKQLPMEGNHTTFLHSFMLYFFHITRSLQSPMLDNQRCASMSTHEATTGRRLWTHTGTSGQGCLPSTLNLGLFTCTWFFLETIWHVLIFE